MDHKLLLETRAAEMADGDEVDIIADKKARAEFFAWLSTHGLSHVIEWLPRIEMEAPELVPELLRLLPVNKKVIMRVYSAAPGQPIDAMTYWTYDGSGTVWGLVPHFEFTSSWTNRTKKLFAEEREYWKEKYKFDPDGQVSRLAANTDLIDYFVCVLKLDPHSRYGRSEIVRKFKTGELKDLDPVGNGIGGTKIWSH